MYLKETAIYIIYFKFAKFKKIFIVQYKKLYLTICIKIKFTVTIFGNNQNVGRFIYVRCNDCAKVCIY